MLSCKGKDDIRLLIFLVTSELYKFVNKINTLSRLSKIFYYIGIGIILN